MSDVSRWQRQKCTKIDPGLNNSSGYCTGGRSERRHDGKLLRRSTSSNASESVRMEARCGAAGQDLILSRAGGVFIFMTCFERSAVSMPQFYSKTEIRHRRSTC